MRVRVHRRLVFPMRSGRYSTGVTCKAARRAAAWQKSNCCKSRISSYLERYSYELLCMETAKTVTDDDRERVRTFYSFAYPLSVTAYALNLGPPPVGHVSDVIAGLGTTSFHEPSLHNK